MQRILIIFFLSSFFLFSCKESVNDETKFESLKKQDTIRQYFTVKISEPLLPEAKEFVKGWGEYQNLNKFLKQHASSNAEETMFNAKELSRLASEMKDSIRIEALKTPAYQIRLNVLQNEALRLKDMSELPNLPEQTIIDEYKKIYAAFSAFNSKLNNNLKQDKLNNELKDFVDMVKNDTVRKDSLIEKYKTVPKLKILNMDTLK